MDTLQIRLILPNDAMARQVEQRLADHARIEREPAQTMSLETIVLLVGIGSTLVGMLNTRAQTEATIAATRAQTEAAQAQTEATRMATYKLMLELQQQLRQQGQADSAKIGPPDGPLRPFAEADEAFLRHLLGLPAA